MPEVDQNAFALVSPRINEGTIEITCQTEAPDSQHLISQMYMRSLDVARTSVNLIAFPQGIGLTAIIDSITHPDGRVHHLHMAEPGLKSGVFCTAYNMTNENFDKLREMIIAEPRWLLAMNDLIQAIAQPHATPVNCARAIDAIRLMIRSKGDKKDGWKEMHAALNLTHEYLKIVTEESKDFRHGDTRFLPYETETELRVRAWVAMNRFMEYRLRGNQPLPITEFPVLT